MTNEHLGTDIKLVDNDIVIDAKNSFVFVSDESNIMQSIYTGLSTILGELDWHPDYGSGLNEVKGKKRNILTLNHAKLVVREALLKMPRVDEIVSVNASYDNSNFRQINITIIIVPINQTVQLNLVYPLFL